jgi:hypothetical protein
VYIVLSERVNRMIVRSECATTFKLELK